MSEVEIVAVYECYNLNLQKFENIIHTFFAEACLRLDIYGADNRRYNPREWFILPMEIIHNVIELIISGEIINYKYNHQNTSIQKFQDKLSN